MPWTPRFRLSPGRGPAVAAEAMVATSQVPATLAGLELLRQGGNAADAAVGAAACLCVAEPMSNGLGGDGFALVWDGQKAHGLDAGGAAPAGAAPGPPAAAGPSSAVVPALVAGWAALSGRFGRLGLDRCLQPAIDLAERGVAAGAHCAHAWATSPKAPPGLGPAPRLGESFHLPGLAATLRLVAEGGPEAFYRGPVAQAIAALSWLEEEDLAAATASWVTPLSLGYRGVEVLELPPPTQGIAALEGLGLLERLGEPSLANQVRAMALALEDARQQVRDGAELGHLLAPAALGARAAQAPRLLPEPHGGTVYLCALDGDGLAVSLIQSLSDAFGSGVLVPGTGVVLNNRAAGFALGGSVVPGRRPYHTTIPGLLLQDGSLRGPFGVMGGLLQAQAHLQLVSALVDRELDPQAALDLPRFRLEEGRLLLEEGLWDRRHSCGLPPAQVVLEQDRQHFGGGQAIQVLEGRILGGSDPRKDGLAAGW